ncbi:MAG: TetR/AcrR family transcriptional regulator [Kofleriaceae bacterium]
MTPTSTPRPRWQRRSEDRPAELVAAALALFAERGFARTRLADVAARAHVSKATVYVYFANKERLFEAVVRETVTPNVDRAEALIRGYDGSTPALLRTLLLLFDGLLDSPMAAVLKVVLAEAGNFPELARVWGELVLQRMFALVQGVIARGIERKEFRVVNPAEMVPLVMSPLLLLGLWKHSLAPHVPVVLDRHAVLAAHADVLLRGLARPEDAHVQG